MIMKTILLMTFVIFSDVSDLSIDFEVYSFDYEADDLRVRVLFWCFYWLTLKLWSQSICWPLGLGFYSDVYGLSMDFHENIALGQEKTFLMVNPTLLSQFSNTSPLTCDHLVQKYK